QLVQELSPERDLNRTPLFQVKLVLQNVPQVELRSAGVGFSGFGANNGMARFDLTFFLEESREGIRGAVGDARDLCEATRIRRLLCHLRQVLECLSGDVQERIGDLSLLTASERQQLLVEWSDTIRNYDERQCVHGLFERQAEKLLDAVSVISEGEHL